jgi:hypothetical protein
MWQWTIQREKLARLRERLSDPLLSALTIMLLVLLFAIEPMQVAGVITGNATGLVFDAMLIVAAFMVSGSGVAFGAIVIAAILVVAAVTLHLPSTVEIYLDTLAWLIAGVTLSIVVAQAVYAPGKVTLHRIVGAVFLYLNVGLIFVALFGFVALVVPDAFSGLGPIEGNLIIAGKLVYFSFVTLTTTGYGDITPLHPYARSLANLEAIFGQLYPATLLARLVTLELEQRQRS